MNPAPSRGSGIALCPFRPGPKKGKGQCLTPILVVLLAGCGIFGISPGTTAAERRYEQRLEEGRQLARRGKMAEAAEAFEDATYANPDGADGHYMLAKALVKTGQQYRALDELRTAERLRPEHGAQRILLGRVLTELGRLDEAHPILADAVSRWPDDAGAQYAMGLLMLRLERLAEAEVRLARALRISPRHRGALEAAGRVLLRLGRTEQAIDRFETVARLTECNDLALGGLAAALVVDGRAAQGQSSFQDAMGCATPSHRTAWQAGLAMAYAADRRWELAEEELGDTGDFFPPPARAAMEERLGQARESFRAAGCTAHEMVCGQANARLWAGLMLLSVLGAPDAAERELREAVSLYDGDPMTRWALAEALAELERESDAVLELDRADAWEPGESLSDAMTTLRRRLRGGDAP